MKLLFLVLSVLLASCAPVLIKHEYDPTASITEAAYSKNASDKGVVLLATNWSRAWNCGGFENAELRSIGFDKLPPKNNSDNLPPSFILNGSAGRPGFTNFAFLLEPGEYGISYINIKVEKSVSDVGYLSMKRSKLLKSNSPIGGTFNVEAGKTVYIGHFGLDCATQPMLWRYYTEDQESFQSYINSYKSQYPYLNLNEVKFQLFSTKEFGNEFSL